MKILASIALAACVACWTSGTLLAQALIPPAESVVVAGTGIEIQPPAGFDKATNFHGFQDESTAGSVMITVIPGPYTSIARGFTEQKLASQGMSLISKKMITVDGKEAQLLHVAQNAYGQMFKKWIALFGEGTRTTLVTGTFLAANTEQGEILKTTVLSAKPTNRKAAAARLPFQFNDVEGLKPVEQMKAFGKMAAYTINGKMPLAKKTDPIFIAAPSVASVVVNDPKEHAIQRVNQTVNTKITALNQVSAITINGVSGIELEADGRLKDSNEAVVVYQVMLFTSDTDYVIMSSRIGKEQSKSYLPKFKALAKSVKLSSSTPPSE